MFIEHRIFAYYFWKIEKTGAVSAENCHKSKKLIVKLIINWNSTQEEDILVMLWEHIW